MSLMCGCESEQYIELPENLETSQGTEFCRECGKLIPVGEEHYKVRLWNFDEWGDECEKGGFPVCESCGDLAISVMALGYCWMFGSLREDVRELAEFGL